LDNGKRKSNIGGRKISLWRGGWWKYIFTLRKVPNFSARGKTWNVDIVDEVQAGEFVEIYSDEDDTYIRSTPYWEGMHLPIAFYINDGDNVYDKRYPLEDMSDSSDEEFKKYLVQNLKKAVNDIPEDIFDKYIK